MARVAKLAAVVELPSLQSRSPQLEKFKKVMEQSRREAARLEAIIEKRRVDMENRRAQIEHNKKKRQEELKRKDEEVNKKMIIKKKMTKKVNKAPPVISSPVIDVELEANVTQPLLSVFEVSQLDSEAVVVPHSDSSFSIDDSEGLVVISQSSPSPLTVIQGVEDLIEVGVVAAPKNAVEVRGFNPLTQVQVADDDNINQIIKGGEEERPNCSCTPSSPVISSPLTGVDAASPVVVYEAEAVVGAPKWGAAYHSKPQLEAEAVVGGPKPGAAYHSEPQLEAAVVCAPKSGAAYHSETQMEVAAIEVKEEDISLIHDSKTVGIMKKKKTSSDAAPANNKTGPSSISGIGPLAIRMRKQAEIRKARTQSTPFEIEMRKLARDAQKLKQERKKLEREREEEKLKAEDVARAIQEMGRGLKEIKMGLAFI